MICIGFTPSEKRRMIDEYCSSRGITHVVMLSPKKFAFDVTSDRFRAVDWPDIIMYATFYPLLQEIDRRTLVVVNECLRDQNRHCLTYNCIRHYLTQTRHQIAFQWLPMIDTIEDFQILFDFDTQSRWKRERFDRDLLDECDIRITPRCPTITRADVPTDAKTRSAYETERDKLFAGLGTKDPHTIPRQLHLLGGKAKAAHLSAGATGLARNGRLKTVRTAAYKDDAYPEAPYEVIDFPHNFIDLSDVMSLSGQTEFRTLVSDIRVDDWYFNRYSAWAGRLADGYSDLQS